MCSDNRRNEKIIARLLFRITFVSKFVFISQHKRSLFEPLFKAFKNDLTFLLFLLRSMLKKCLLFCFMAQNLRKFSFHSVFWPKIMNMLSLERRDKQNMKSIEK